MWVTLFLYFVLPVSLALWVLRLKPVQKFLEPWRNRLYYKQYSSQSRGHGQCNGKGHGQCNNGQGQGHGQCNGKGHGQEHGQCNGKGHGQEHGQCNGQGHGQDKGHGHSHEHRHHGEGHDEAKTILFQDLKTTNSKLKELKGNGNIRILEIGVGPGVNFKFYPEKCQYIGVDPNTSFREDVTENLKKFPGIELLNFFHTGAEEMGSIPDESVDVVVTTAVLCSVKDLQTVFKEIRRVLVPGGKYYYLEHIAEESNTKEYWMQRIVTLGIQIVSFTGLMHAAHMDRKIDQEVLKAGFSSIDQKYSRFEMKGGSVIRKLAARQALGVAVK